MSNDKQVQKFVRALRAAGCMGEKEFAKKCPYDYNEINSGHGESWRAAEKIRIEEEFKNKKRGSNWPFRDRKK